MVQKPTVVYQYALNLKDQVVNVADLPRTIETRRDIYHCLSCEQLLRPVLGEIRQKHFRHEVEVNCSPETYLHQLAKRLFFQIYKNCLQTNTPFGLELQIERNCSICQQELGFSCQLEPEPKVFNLAKLFPLISIEIQDGEFIPDILLSNEKGEKVYVEFVVTHISTEQKIGSGARIIELSFETEDDLEPIRERLISKNHSKTKLFNFKDIVKTRNNGPVCNRKVYFFLLYTDGRALIICDTATNYKSRLKGGNIAYSKPLPHGGPQIYFDELEKAFQEKRKIRSCFLCRYHGDNLYREDDERPIYCKFLKKVFVSTEAVPCEYYRADPTAFPSQNNIDRIVNALFHRG